MRIKPISLSDQIYSDLKHRVLTCELSPGQRLVEKALCEELGVSRASLREALNRLSQERLVIARPNRGYCVTPITEKHFRSICELRRVLESQVAGLAATRATPESIERMRKAAYIDCSLEDENAFMVYCDSNRSFHQSIVESIDNELLMEIVMSALDKDQQPLFYGIDLEVCTKPENVTEEHLAIVDAIGQGDEIRASQLMKEHIGEKEDRIIAALAAKGCFT